MYKVTQQMLPRNQLQLTSYSKSRRAGSKRTADTVYSCDCAGCYVLQVVLSEVKVTIVYLLRRKDFVYGGGLLQEFDPLRETESREAEPVVEMIFL